MLGLKLDQDFGGQWVEYDIKGETFAITAMMESHQPGAKGAGIAFEVDDLDASVAQLKRANVKFVMDIFESPVCRMAVIADPDGNHIVIHKRHK